MTINTNQDDNYGPIIGIVVVTAFLFFGGWFFFYSQGLNNSPINSLAPAGWEVATTSLEDQMTNQLTDSSTTTSSSTPLSGATTSDLENQASSSLDYNFLNSELDGLSAELSH